MAQRLGVRDLVIRTRDWPVLGACYRAVYEGAVRLAALLLAVSSGRSLTALHLRRGLSSRGVTPGVSDVDLLMVLDIRPERETAFLRGLWRWYGFAKRFLPLLGELQVATRAELSAYLSWGGARRLEARDWRPLRGAPPPTPAGAGPEASVLHLHEALAAYIFLVQTYFESARLPHSPDFGFRMTKGFLDVLRHAAAAQKETPIAMDRSQALAVLADECSPEIRRSLERPERMAREEALELVGLALRRLDGFGCRSGAGAWTAWPAGKPYAPPENARAHEWPGRLAALGPGAGFFMDTLFHWYVVLPEAPAADALRRVAGQMVRWHRQESRFGGAGWLVTKRVLQGLLLSPHLDTPFLAWTLGGKDRGDGLWIRSVSRHPLWADQYRLRWGLDLGLYRPPSSAELLRCARQATTELALSLRLFGLRSWAGANAYRIFFLYSRILSLRLFFDCGMATDPNDLDGLIEAYQDRFPDTRPWLARLVAEDLQRAAPDFDEDDPARLFYRHLPFLRRQLDAAAASQSRIDTGHREPSPS